MTHETMHAPIRRRVTHHLILTAVVTLLALFTLAACGGDDSSTEDIRTSSNGEKFSDADVAFAGDMIQHHAQALAMVDMTLGRDLDPEVAALAEEIRAAQTPEIEQMSDWLQSWGEPVPATSRDHANSEGGGQGMDLGDMPGMMAEDEMSELEGASDAEFEAMWLEMMIAHHQGAVEMAKREQSDGTFEPAVDLAAHIESSQTEEIEAMQQLLDRLGR